MSEAERERAALPEELARALHAERVETNTQSADCWACEASRSAVFADLLSELRKAQSVASHANAMLARAVPDEEALLEMWRDHWRNQLEFRRRRGELGRSAAGLPAYRPTLPPVGPR